jgi:hypothetical protein
MDGAPEVFSDLAAPASLADRRVNSVEPVPALLFGDVREVGCGELLLEGSAWSRARSCKRGGRAGRRDGKERGMRESDVDAMDSDSPVQIRLGIFKVG